MSLWILDSTLTVSGVIRPWEVLLHRQVGVSLDVDWSNGAKFSVVNAESAMLTITPVTKTGEVLDDD